jgi:hypothetical protein
MLRTLELRYLDLQSARWWTGSHIGRPIRQPSNQRSSEVPKFIWPLRRPLSCSQLKLATDFVIGSLERENRPGEAGVLRTNWAVVPSMLFLSKVHGQPPLWRMRMSARRTMRRLIGSCVAVLSIFVSTISAAAPPVPDRARSIQRHAVLHQRRRARHGAH